jgi:DNA primase
MGIVASDFRGMTPTGGERLDWSAIRSRVDLATVATNLLGPAHQRQGQRLLWSCPFHEDQNPSFQVDLSRKTWRCWTCAIGGDAAELVKRVKQCDFRAAVKFLADLAGVVPSQGPTVRPPAAPLARKPPSPPPERPTGLPSDEASDLVEEACRTLWGPGGQSALNYLHRRGLTDITVRAAGLGSPLPSRFRPELGTVTSGSPGSPSPGGTDPD